MSGVEQAKQSPSGRDLLCFGDLNVDITVSLRHDLVLGSDTDGAVKMTGGGSAANVAAWAATTGQSVRFVGPLGDDQLGDYLVSELSSHGVRVEAVRRAGASTRAVAAIVGVDGNRSLVSDQNNVIALAENDYSSSWLDGVEWLHLTAYTYIAERSRALYTLLRSEAAARSIPVSIDPSAAALLRTNCDRHEVLEAFGGVDILFPSHDEAEYLSESSDPKLAAEQLLDLADCVAVTCGEDGAYVARRGVETLSIAAEPTELVNTLGCGDAFAAGFIAATLAGSGPEQIGRQAVGLAAAATRIASAR